MLGRMPLHRITLDILNEELYPGPRGARIKVIDFDGRAGCYYQPVDLDDPAVLMQGGLEPTESDPRFHQQMVYAVAMKVIENFEVALGRRFNFRGRQPLRIFPHAFYGDNAFYDPQRHALLFGYFRANAERPGANAPGQTIFTCLSHDIIAHEMTHAVVQRLRRYFSAPTNADVLAFHEGFADIIAIFQHFGFRDILRDSVQRTRGDLRRNTPLVELAEQFGHATGKGTALRSAIDQPDPARLQTAVEAHERGAILVAAVFDAYFRTYQERVQDLIRIATGGTGQLPEGDLRPELVNRIGDEAAETARATLRMCIRAFDYLPPVDVTFGDYLRAMVTADFELNPADQTGLRRQVIEAFRLRGIYPSGVTSLAEDSLRWERYDSPSRGSLKLPEGVTDLLNGTIIAQAAWTSRNSALDARTSALLNVDVPQPRLQKLFTELIRWAAKNWQPLHLVRNAKIELAGIHAAFRVAQDGQLLVETVAQFVQKLAISDPKLQIKLGGMQVRGGSTVVAKANGNIQYVIRKRLNGGRAVRRLAAYVAELDGRDAFQIWRDKSEQRDRIAKRVNLAAAHRGAF